VVPGNTKTVAASGPAVTLLGPEKIWEKFGKYACRDTRCAQNIAFSGIFMAGSRASFVALDAEGEHG